MISLRQICTINKTYLGGSRSFVSWPLIMPASDSLLIRLLRLSSRCRTRCFWYITAPHAQTFSKSKTIPMLTTIRTGIPSCKQEKRNINIELPNTCGSIKFYIYFILYQFIYFFVVVISCLLNIPLPIIPRHTWDEGGGLYLYVFWIPTLTEHIWEKIAWRFLAVSTPFFNDFYLFFNSFKYLHNEKSPGAGEKFGNPKKALVMT